MRSSRPTTLSTCSTVPPSSGHGSSSTSSQSSTSWKGRRSLPRRSSGATPSADQLMGGCCPVVELRQYTLRPGQRDVLIELFDREFVESQEAAGMEITAQFRDLDRPDRFVWLRGFPDMERRRLALEAFYGGP